jgi:membrane protein YqaA with SNARE-associated domain
MRIGEGAGHFCDCRCSSQQAARERWLRLCFSRRGSMRAWTTWIFGLFLSPVGVTVLAALDSTLFFSLPFGIDAAVILLAARHRDVAWTIPLLAVIGSVAGAALTFWMGVIIGEKGLDRYVAPKRLKQVRQRIRDTGAIALAVLDLIPPPFPFTGFVLAAGALEVDVKLFFVTLVICRALRFGFEALLAYWYGRTIVRWLDSDLFHDVVGFFIVAAILGSIITIVRLVRATRPRRQPRPA